ncbi:MAG: hypothetical protein JST04_18145 [Bdellovibrionales bacterium]|nr:hypothetical protein [Bdellovibrionales bacterium]
MSLTLRAMILGTIGVVSFGAGLLYSMHASAAETQGGRRPAARTKTAKRPPKTVMPKNTEVDFEGLAITGELRNPGDFYFQRKTEEKFDSLVKRRKNFHREMLRDVVMAK